MRTAAHLATLALYAGVALGVLYIVAHVLRALLGVDLLTAAAYVLGLAIGITWLAQPFLANVRSRRP